MNKQQLFEKLYKSAYLVDATSQLSYAMVKLVPVVFDAKLDIWITDSSRASKVVSPYKINGTIVGFLTKSKNQLDVFINFHKSTFLKNPRGCISRYCEEDGEEIMGNYYGCW